MRTTFHHGMKSVVSVGQFTQEFELRHAKASISLAKRTAKRMARVARERIALNYDRNVVLADVTLGDMARLYQVEHALIPFTVALTKQLAA